MADQGSQGVMSPWLRAQRIAAATPFVVGEVLDFGCGSGALAGHVAPVNYLGFDPDLQSIESARQQYPRHRFVTQEDMIEGPFDTVVCLAVIEHVPDPVSFLRNLAGFLGASGTIVLSTPHPAFEWVHSTGARIGLFSHDASEEHEALLDRKRIEEIAAEAGLQVVRFVRFLFGANQLAVVRPR